LHLVSFYLGCRTLILVFINLPSKPFLFIASNSYFFNWCHLVEVLVRPTKMDANHTLFSSVTLLHEVPLLGYQVYNVCVNHPMKIVSDGMWSHASSIPSQSSYTILQLQIVIIFIVTQSFHFILKQLGIPYFVSQVMVGIYPLFYIYILITFILLVSIPSF